MERALSEGVTQTGIFTEFTEAIESEDAARVATARAAIMTWEQDPEKKDGTPCPYHVDKSSELVLLLPSTFERTRSFNLIYLSYSPINCRDQASDRTGTRLGRRFGRILGY